MNKLHRSMIGHGLVILLIGMILGVGLLASLLGGMEIIPGSIIPFDMPGDPAAWVRAHIGAMLNGMLIILVAILIIMLKLSTRMAGHLRWMLVGTGYANTFFYLVSMLAPNRALSFADNNFGEANIFSVLGLVPTLIFVVASIVAISMLIYSVFSTED